jgi:hypothetical protein
VTSGLGIPIEEKKNKVIQEAVGAIDGIPSHFVSNMDEWGNKMGRTGRSK